jgi:hypothetical protein
VNFLKFSCLADIRNRLGTRTWNMDERKFCDVLDHLSEDESDWDLGGFWHAGERVRLRHGRYSEVVDVNWHTSTVH